MNSKNLIWASASVAALFVGIGWYGVAPLIAHDPTPEQMAAVFLESRVQGCLPERLEDLRYLLSMVIAPLVFGLSLFLLRRRSQRNPAFSEGRLLAFNRQAAQAALALFAAYHWYAQEHRYFSDRTALIVALSLFALGIATYKPVLVRLARFKWAAHGVGLGLTAVFLLANVFTNDTIGLAHEGVQGHLQVTSAEFAAVLNGRKLFVDFFPQYQNLSPYLFSPYFKVFGFSTTTFCTLMLMLNALGICFVYLTLQLFTGSAWGGLFLYIPWIAATFRPMTSEPGGLYYNILNYYAIAPLRYFGPWALTYCLARYLLRPAARKLIALSAMATWLAVNNLDFGVPAYGGLVLAVLAVESSGATDWQGLKASFARATAGLLIGIAAYFAFVFAAAGALPDFKPIFEFQSVFFKNGFMSIPAPVFGLHWVIFITQMLALCSGISLLFFDRRPEAAERLRAGLLVFSGVFGAGSLTYYIGRSHPYVLVAAFPSWTFSMMLLTWPVLKRLPALTFRSSKRALAAAFCALFLYGSVVQSLRYIPAPWVQLKRLSRSDQGAVDAERAKVVRLIREFARPGEKVGIAYTNAHRLALESGTDNIYPFAHIASLITKSQLKAATDAFERHDVKLIFGSTSVVGEFDDWLRNNGFVEKASTPMLWGEADFKVYSR